MIRRKFVLLSVILTLLLNTLLFATWYQSNILGQPLQAITEDEREQFTYFLHIEKIENKTTSTLYHNSQMVQKVERTISGDTTVVTLLTYDENKVGKESKKTYKGGLLQQSLTTEEGLTTEIMYTYENNQLIEETLLVDNKMKALTTFYRFYDGSLAGTRVIDMELGTFVTLYDSEGDVSTLVSDSDNNISLYRIYPNGVIDDSEILTSNAEYDEEGNLRIIETIDGETKVSVYTPKGKLLETQQTLKNDESERRTYEYDNDGNLVHSIQVKSKEDKTRIERWYVNGSLKSQTQWINDIPERSVRYVENGTSIVTMFEDGRPYTDVTYASDGKRVLSIEYRKEQ
jgi:antitoxin component YwqK of YwqJK toxin-antitoxin module